MKIPKDLIEQYKGSILINDSVEIFNQIQKISDEEFLNQLPKIVKDPSVLNSRDSTQILILLDRIDLLLQEIIIKLQLPLQGIDPASTTEKLSIILTNTSKLLKVEYYRILYRQLDRIFLILQFSDNLEVTKLCLHIYYQIFSDPDVRIQELDYIKNEQKQLFYQIKCLYENQSNYNSSAYAMMDLFKEDEGYRNYNQRARRKTTDIQGPEEHSLEVFEFEYTLNLKDSLKYEEIDKKQSIIPLKNSELKKISLTMEELTDKCRTHNCNQIAQEMLEVRDTPLFDSLVWRLRIYINYIRKQNNNILYTYIQALKIYTCLQRIYYSEPVILTFIYSIFVVDYDKILTELLEICYLRVSPEVHRLIFVCIFSMMYQEEHNDYPLIIQALRKNYPLFQKIFKDCSSLKLQKSEGRITFEAETCVLHLETLRDANFQKSILKFIQGKGLEIFLEGELIDIVNCVLKIFNSEFLDNHLTYNLKSLNICSQILSNLVKQEDIQMDFNLLEKILQKMEFAIQMIQSEEVFYQYQQDHWMLLEKERIYEKVAQMLNVINQLFRDKSHRRALPQNLMPTLARKIIESHFLVLLQKLLESEPTKETEILMNTVQLICNLSGEAPNLIPKLISNKILPSVVSILKKIEVPSTHKSVTQIINFMNHVSLKQEGKDLIMSANLLPKIFQIFTSKSSVVMWNNKGYSSIANSLIEYTNNIDKVHETVKCLIIETMQKLIEMHIIFMNKIEAYMNMKEDPHPEFPFSVSNFNLFSKLLQNFLRFFKELFKNEFPLTRDLLQDKSFDLMFELLKCPVVGLLDNKELKVIFQTIKAIGKIYQQFDPENMTFKLFKIVQHELKELEGIIGDVLFNLTDFSSLVSDRICYETRVNDLSKLMENRDPSLIKPIYLIGKLNYLEALIEILAKIYSGAKNNIKEVDIIQMLNKFKSLYRVILNQICREEQFFLNETRQNLLLENNDTKKQECVKSFKEIIYFSRQDKHLFLHNSLRKFFLQVITKSVSGTQKNFNIEFVQCYSILITLVYKNINIEQLQLNDSFQREKNVNILMHANINLQHLVDLTQSFLEENKRRGMGIMVWPISIITTLYDEGAFEKFFGFLMNFIISIQDYVPNVSDDINSQLLDVAINYLCEKLTMIIKSLIFQQIDVTGTAKLGGSKQSGKVLQETSNWILLDQMENLLKIFEALNTLPAQCKQNGSINKLMETLLEKIFKLSQGNVTKILLKSQQQIQREQRYRRFAPYGTNEVPEDIQQQIDDTITQLVAMGFQRERAEIAVNNIEELDLDLACEFLSTHRDELIKSETRRLKKMEEEEQKKLKEQKVQVEKVDLNKSALQQVSEEDFAKLYQKKLIEYGKMFVRKLYSYQGFENLIGDILILLYTKFEDQSIQSEMVYVLFEMLKQQSNQMFVNYNFKFNLKLNKQSQENVKSLLNVPSKQTYNESLQMLNIILPIIIKFGQSKNTFLTQDMAIEFVRLSKQILLGFKEDQVENLQNYNQRIFIIFLEIIKTNKDRTIYPPLLQYILQLLICNNNLYKQHNKNLINGNTLQGILTLLIWTCKKRENRNWIHENKVVVELFRLQDINQPGLLDLFYKFLEVCVCDSETEKACVEIAIKKLFYDETIVKNQKDFSDKSMFQDAKSFNSNDQVIKKEEEGPKSGSPNVSGEQVIEKEPLPKKDLKNINLQAKETLIDMNKFLTYFTNLFNKGCVLLNPESPSFLEVFQQTCVIQVKEEKEPNKKDDAQYVSLKENQSLITNYTFFDSTQQSILNSVLENIIFQFNHEIIGDKKECKVVFNYNLLLRLLHLLIRNYPVLTPYIIKFKVGKFMKKFTQIQTKPSISFLSYLIRIVVKYSIDKFQHFIYELCLDTNLLFENKSMQIKVFSSEIRKRILHEIHEILDNEVQTYQNVLERHSSIQMIIAYTSLHAHLLSLTEVAKLSIKNEDTPHNFNFIKVYSDIFKQLDVSKYYQVEKILPYLTHTLSILHQVALHFVISNKVLIPQPITNTNSYIDEINKFQLLPTNVLKKDKFSAEWIQIHEVRPVRQMRQGLIPFGEMVNQHEENDSAYEFEEEGLDLLGEEDEGSYDGEEDINIDQEEEEIEQEDEEEDSANDSYQLENQPQNENYQVYQNQSDSGEHNILEPDSEDNENQDQSQDVDNSQEQLNLPEVEVQESEIIQSPKETVDNEKVFSKTILDLNLQKNSKQIIKFEHLHISQPFAKVYQEFSEYIKCLYDTPLQGMDASQEGRSLIQKTNEIYQKISQQDTSIFSTASDSWKQLNYEFMKVSDHERRYVYDLYDEDDPVNILDSHLIDSNGLLNEHTLHQLRSTRLRADLLRRILFNDPNSGGDDRYLSQIENIMRYNERGTHSRVQGHFERVQQPPVTAENINLIRNRFMTQLNRDSNQEIPSQVQNELPLEHPSSLIDQPDIPSSHPIIENLQQNFENIVIEMNQQQEDSLSPHTEPMDPDIYQQVDDEENIYHDVLEEIKQEQEQAPQQVQEPQQVLSDDILNSIMQLSQQFMQNTQVQQPPSNQINNESMLLIQQMSQQFNQISRVEPPKEEHKQQVEEVKSTEALPDFLERSLEVLKTFDLDLTFFDRYKIDPLVFDSLPDEFKLDCILQYLPQEQQRMQHPTQQQEQQPQGQPQQQAPQMQQLIPQEIQEFLDALPENMRAEQQNLLVQQQNNNPPPVQGDQGNMDNETFLATLPPDLREEVLMTASPEFLASLPQEIRDEADQLRARRSRRFDYGFNMENIFDLHHERINQLENRRQHELKQKGEKQQDIKELIQKDKNLLSKLQATDEKLIETILKLLYADNLAFSKFPYYLFQTLATNPITEYKLMDALMFILKTREIPQLKKICGLDSQAFPSTCLYERARVIKNYKKVHNLISLKILYIFSKISQNSINFFIHPYSYFQKKDKKLAELQSLSLYKQELKYENKNVPFIQLINLLINEEDGQQHLQYLVSVLYNVIKKYFLLEPDKQSESKFRLEAEPIRFICQALSSDNINQETIKKLSMIINNLCFDKINLQFFIQELRSIIMFYSAHINEVVERSLSQLYALREQNDSEQEIKLIRDIEQNVDGEKKVHKIFLIIKQLFETSFSKSVELEENQTRDKKEEVSEVPLEKKEEKEEKGEKQDKDKQFKEMMETIKSQIRSSFQNLINDNLLHQMWINITELFSILSEKHSTGAMQSIIDKLSPLIECYMIIYKIMHDDDDDIVLKKKQTQNIQKKKNISQLLSIEKEHQSDIKDQKFSALRESFTDSKNVFDFICEKAKLVINQMIKLKLKQIKNNQTKNIYNAFIKEPLGIIIKQIPKIIDFENKKQYFKLELKNLKGTNRHAPVRIRVERSRVFLESFNKINYLMASEMKGKFSIEFAGEEGMDAGGVSREWFLLLSKQIFNPDYGLFKLSSTGNTYQPNKNSWINPDHLKFFKFIGRIMGKALYDGYMLDAFFTRSFYKHILGQPITYHDMQDQDYEYYKSLKWIVENSTEGVTELFWSYEFDNFGKVEQADLIPNGRNIRVTEDEKLSYVQKVCYAKMAEEIKPQIEAFLEGFHELIPSNLITIFDSHEFELMISGLPDIDLQDLKENTDYHNYTANDIVIQWLWEILDQFDKSQIAAFLQFVTGTSKIPLDGFKALRGMHGPQKFNITKAYDANKLPSAHTCFNQLDLPEYPSKDILIEKLMMAIMEGKEGFGFA